MIPVNPTLPAETKLPDDLGCGLASSMQGAHVSEHGLERPALRRLDQMFIFGDLRIATRSALWSLPGILTL